MINWRSLTAVAILITLVLRGNQTNAHNERIEHMEPGFSLPSA